MNIIGKRNWYFLFSILVIIPGLVALYLWGLNLSIEFTGGSRITLAFKEKVTSEQAKKIEDVLRNEKIKVSTVERSNNIVFIRSEQIDQKKNNSFINNLKEEIKDFDQKEFETIGPSIGAEIASNAVKAIVLACVLIVIYITWAFRSVPKPASSFRFGVCAVVALVHDVLVIVGIFAILGHFFGVEIDSLFVTAVLTIIGFSVHDTIVVFDRIRENLKRRGSQNFENIVNDSILQTLDRSVNTSLTVVLVLVALLLFGGESIRWFVVALLLGIVSGTYSSIFNAAPLLVVWQNFKNKRLRG